MGSIEIFDEYADAYDAWFLQNRQVLTSELPLVKRALGSPGRTLSVGCGSGLFESLLRREHGVTIECGVEPAEGMARIAEKRGLKVKLGVAESLPHEDESFDTVLQNGTPAYTKDLAQAFREAFRVVRKGGRFVVLDVPAESSYGLLYRLATVVGRWDDPRLLGSAPAHPYPIEFAAAALWRTTEEKTRLLQETGFVDLEYFQTLTRHPRFSDDAVEEPTEGFDRGDYVAIRARRP